MMTSRGVVHRPLTSIVLVVVVVLAVWITPTLGTEDRDRPDQPPSSRTQIPAVFNRGYPHRGPVPFVSRRAIDAAFSTLYPRFADSVARVRGSAGWSAFVARHHHDSITPDKSSDPSGVQSTGIAPTLHEKNSVGQSLLTSSSSNGTITTILPNPARLKVDSSENSVSDNTVIPSVDYINRTYDILTEMYWALDGPRWRYSSNWLNRTVTYCEWFGILCCRGVWNFTPCSDIPDRYTIYGIILLDNGMSGTMPASFASLATAQPWVTLVGMVENAVTMNLAQFQPFTSLTFLLLSNTHLSGSLNDFDFLALPSVIDIAFTATNVSGSIPASLFTGLANMTYFFVSSPRLTGSLPREVRPDSAISGIIVAASNIVGRIPESWSTLANLFYLNLGVNNLTGPFPAALFSIPAFRYLDVSNNNLSGPISMPPGTTVDDARVNASVFTPMTFTRSYNYVDMSYNQLSGTIPGIHCLIYRGSNNRFNASVDTAFLDLFRCGSSELDFSHNPFQPGLFPDLLTMYSNLNLGEVYNAETLVSLSMANVNFYGTIHPAVMTTFFPFLEYVDLSLNPGLGGPVPVPWLTSSVAINTLLLTGCRFSQFGFILRPNVTDFDESSDPDRLRGQGTLTPGRMWNYLPAFDPASNYTTFVQAIDPYSSAEGTLPLSTATVTSWGSYSCPAIQWPRATLNVLGITPAYWNYSGCACNRGYHGKSPDCVQDSNPSTAMEISIPIIIILCLTFTVAVLVRRRIQHLRRERKADAMLAGYAAMKRDPENGTSRSERRTVGWRNVFRTLFRFLSTDASDPATRQTMLRSSLLHDRGKEDQVGIEMWATESTNFTRSGTSNESSKEILDKRFDSDSIIPFKKIDILRTIAHGASGFVSVGVWQNVKVAVKQFYPGMTIDQSVCVKEARLHARLRHPNIVLLMGVCLEPLCTVTEFMDRGSLFHILRTTPGDMEVRGRRRGIGMQIAQGMQYLHGKGILHRDLKSLNILIDGNWTAKVADFGESRQESGHTMTAGIGTTCWMSPESFEGGHYTLRSDVYSYGILIWELVSGLCPFEEYKFAFEIMDAVRKGVRPSIPSRCRGWCRAMIERCWDGCAENRPTFEEILEIYQSHEDEDIVQWEESGSDQVKTTDDVKVNSLNIY